MQRKWHGFTLIELLIVVIAISLISAIAIPRLLARLNPPEELTPAPEVTLVTDVGDEESTRPRGVLPVIEAAQIKVDLQAREQRVGIDVVNRYRAEVSGALEILPANDDEESPTRTPTRIEVPFPESVTEIVEFSMWLQGRGRDGAPAAGELELRESGFRWVGDVAPAEDGQGPLQVRFTYVVAGEDRFTLGLPAARRLRHVEVDVLATGLPGAAASADSLLPTAQAGDSLTWRFQNLVSQRPIEVVFPGAESPLGRAMRLFQLAGLAVLLFGAGFWYLGELYRPGRLDSFRWGHFLLLAITYSFFFVVLAVLGYRGWSPAESLAASALLSLPLLLFHVATIFDQRFAWTQALPVAALTMLVVTNGIYGGPWKMLVYLGVAALVVTGLTLTYPVLHRRSEARGRQREEVLARRIEALSEEARQGELLCDQTDNELAVDDPSCMERLREQLYQSGQVLREHLSDCTPVFADHELLLGRVGLATRRRHHETLAAQLSGHETSLARCREQLAEALRHTAQGREKAAERLQDRDDHPLHCASCGGSVGDARFCPGCGQEAPALTNCKSCGHELRMPKRLLAEGVRLGNLHCMSCGEFPRTQTVGVGAEEL